MFGHKSQELGLGECSLGTPVFFPSISSVKTNLDVFEYVSVLSSLGALNRQFLVSAYDLARSGGDSIESALVSEASADGITLLMDSGNYESYWLAPDTPWSRQEFHDVLKAYRPPLAFCFDSQSLPDGLDQQLDALIEGYASDLGAAGQTFMIPIVHGNRTLPSLCARFAAESGVPFLAVPERELGDGIFERLATVRNIRHHLDDLGSHTGLHLLGTGNPISLALYAFSGADSFDGLEWCQTVVSHETALLYHFSQADFFLPQTDWGTSELSYPARVLAHNIEFYRGWLRDLSEAQQAGMWVEFCRERLPRGILAELERYLGWE